MITCEQEPRMYPHPFDHNIGTISVGDKLVNSSCTKNQFCLPITLWVYGKKVQVEALIDSGATTSFINKRLVEEKHLVTNRLETVYEVYNADGTHNKNGAIKEAIRGYLEIGSHKSTHQLLVADLGN